MDHIELLIVEDSKIVRLVIAKQLEKLCLTVDVASDGAEAVAAAKQKHYDLIFMDVMMPVMDGLEATRQIRQWEQENNLQRATIVGVTGYVNRTECIAAGMDDFMFKPVTIEQLRNTITHWHHDLPLPPAHKQKRPSEESLCGLPAAAPTEERIEELKNRLGFNAADGDQAKA